MWVKDLTNIAFYSLGFLGLFGLGELIYHVFKAPVEISRKFVHLGTGIITLSFPLVLNTHWSVLTLTLSFILLLSISIQLGWFKSINAIDRVSKGSVLYPIIIYITFLFYRKFDDLLFFYLPILILAISDPMAALFGKRWPYGKYRIFREKKTIVGSSAFFISSFIICLAFAAPLREGWIEALVIPLIVSLVATITEAASQRGWDNFFIPLSVIGSLIGTAILF